MIPALKDTWELQKAFAAVLVEQSGLPEERVINSLSLYGPDFEKLVDGTIYASYEMADCFLFFKLESGDDANFSAPAKDGAIYSYHSFRFHLYVYGNQCHAMALTIRTRLLYDRPQTDLIRQGIHIVNVEKPVLVNEYMNGRMWPRADLEAKVDCRFVTEPLKKSDEFAETDIGTGIAD